MFERVEFILRVVPGIISSPTLTGEDACRLANALSEPLVRDGMQLDKALGLSKQRISIAEEFQLYERARLIREFFFKNFREKGPYPASFEIADNLQILRENRSDSYVDDAYGRLFDDLVTRGCAIPSQKVVRQLLPKGAL